MSSGSSLIPLSGRRRAAAQRERNAGTRTRRAQRGRRRASCLPRLGQAGYSLNVEAGGPGIPADQGSACWAPLRPSTTAAIATRAAAAWVWPSSPASLSCIAAPRVPRSRKRAPTRALRSAGRGPGRQRGAYQRRPPPPPPPGRRSCGLASLTFNGRPSKSTPFKPSMAA